MICITHNKWLTMHFPSVSEKVIPRLHVSAFVRYTLFYNRHLISRLFVLLYSSIMQIIMFQFITHFDQEIWICFSLLLLLLTSFDILWERIISLRDAQHLKGRLPNISQLSCRLNTCNCVTMEWDSLFCRSTASTS